MVYSRSLSKFVALNVFLLQHSIQDANVAGTCGMTVSPGDEAVGIKIVADSTCRSNPGVGCIGNADCRFCKKRTTPQSGHLPDCSSIPSDSPAPAATTTDPTATPAAGAIGNTASVSDSSCFVSPGDQAVGIQAVADASCVNGGLGCYDGHCRFCKVGDTPQAKHLTACSALGVNFPTISPVADSAIEPSSTTCGVSPGDFAVGINAVADATCANGELGCFNSHCRYCKVGDTPQSKHLLSCISLGADYPTISPMNTNASSSACEVSQGDFNVGINVISDATCANGGLGCYDGHCRFCKYRSTPNSVHLNECSIYGLASVAPTPTPSIAPPLVGGTLDVVAGPTPCPTVKPSPSPTYAATPTPTSSSANVVTSTPTPPLPQKPAPAPTPTPTTTAPFGGPLTLQLDTHLAHRQLSQRLQVRSHLKGHLMLFQRQHRHPHPRRARPSSPRVMLMRASKSSLGPTVLRKEESDALTRCGGVEPGVGCIDSACRFCKFRDTTESANFLPCTLFGYDFFDDAVTPTPAPPTLSVPATVTSESCATKVSEGDKRVGIYGVADVECLGGGVGCNDRDICRLCRLVDTPQSHHLAACPISVVTTTPLSTVATPAPPTNAPLSTSVTSDTCVARISTGDKNVGISAIADPTCAQGGVGCNEIDICRFCKTKDTPQSSQFVACSPSASALLPPTTTAAPAPIRSTSVTAAGCAATVSKGDSAVGISSTVDFSCLNGGVGCNDVDICRLCYLSITPESSHLMSCTSVVQSQQPVLRVRMAAQSEARDEFSKLMDNEKLKWAITGAAFIGVAAVVAMMAMTVKRVMREISSSSAEASGDAGADSGEEFVADVNADGSIMTTQM